MSTVTKIDHYEVMYSANTFPPRIWLYGGGKPLGQLIFMPDTTRLIPLSQVALYVVWWESRAVSRGVASQPPANSVGILKPLAKREHRLGFPAQLYIDEPGTTG